MPAGATRTHSAFPTGSSSHKTFLTNKIGERLRFGQADRHARQRLGEVSAMWMIYTAMGLGIALAVVALYLLSCLRVLTEYERGVIFRLGRVLPKPKGP